MTETATGKKLTPGQYVDYLCDSYGSGRSGADLEHLDEFRERDRKEKTEMADEKTTERQQEFIAWLKDNGLYDPGDNGVVMLRMYEVFEALTTCDCGRPLSPGLCRVCDNDE